MSSKLTVSTLRKELKDVSGYAGQGLRELTIKVLIAILDTLVDIKYELEKQRARNQDRPAIECAHARNDGV